MTINDGYLGSYICHLLITCDKIIETLETLPTYLQHTECIIIIFYTIFY